MIKKKIIFILVFVLITFSLLIISSDNELTFSCSGDNQLSLNCLLGDSQIGNLFSHDSVPPTITLNNPVDFYNSSTSSNVFSANVSDSTGLSYVNLYSNFSGSWGINSTNNSGVNNVLYNFTIAIPEGYYKWAYWSNDTLNNANFSLNRTLLVDTIFPLISYNPSAETNNSYLNRTWALVNISTTDTNLHTTWLSWNAVNQSFTSTSGSNYWENKTGLIDGNYSFRTWANDSAGNTNSTGLRTTVIDTVLPQITILTPTDGQTLGNNISIQLNYSVSDSHLESCKYNVYYQDTFITVPNTTVSCTSNTTFDVPISGTYRINFYANDSAGNTNSTNRSFRVSLSSPAVNLNAPPDNSANLGQNIYFNFTATDSDGISSCDLYSNFSGSWGINETFNSVTSGVQVSTKKNLTAGLYKWNVNCTDTTGLSDFATNNFSVYTDLTKPLVNITTNNNTNFIGFSTTINYNITDNIALNSCYFTLRDSTDTIHNYGENTSFSCASTSRDFSVLGLGTYYLRIWAEDTAGNLNSTTIYFTSLPSPTGGGGTGSSTSAEQVNILTFNQNNLSRFFSDLDRARAYSDFFIICESRYPKQVCNLQQDEFNGVCISVKTDIQSTDGDCLTFYNLYLKDDTKNILVSRELADQFNLIKLIKGERILLELAPFRIDSFWLGKDIFKINVLANKDVKSCSPQPTGKDYNFDCNLTTNTTGIITLKTTEKPFLKTYNGIISWTQAVTGVTSYQTIRIRLVNLFFKVPGLNIRVYQLIIGIMALLVIFLIMRLRVIIRPEKIKEVVKFKKR